MAEIKAVKEPGPDPKVGKPKPKSGVAIPYYDLNQSVEVAKTIHEKGGGHCSREQLAPLLKYSGVKNGGFLTRVAAAKAFGLIEESGETIRLTDRARTILSPVRPEDAERAKVEAFFGVDFFKTLYEKFSGQVLPQEAGLKNLLQNTYAVVPGRIVPSLRVLMDSADQAGFFKTAGNRSRMIKPLVANNPGGGSEHRQSEEPKPNGGDHDRNAEHTRRAHGGGQGGGGGGGGDTEIPPALAGLLKELPPVGTELTAKRRKALTAAFASAIDFLYPEPDNESGQ
ncbi:MAG TPA: hypothetical protein VGH80_14315 [Xanthomonadaceae bacterium]|jgi:hypothetical protein